LTALKKMFWGHARVLLTKTANHVARGIGWFYMVTTCVIQLPIGCQCNQHDFLFRL